MKVTASHTWAYPMIVEAETLRKIALLLSGRFENLNISAECKGRLSCEFQSVDELIGYENTRGERLVKIGFWAYTEIYSNSARISFSASEFRTLDIDVTGDYSDGPLLRDSMLKMVEGSRAWYWPIVKLNFFLLILGCMGIGYFALSSYRLTLPKSNAPEAPVHWWVVVLVPVIMIGLPLIGLLTNRFRDIIFPSMIFLVGQEIGRHKVRERWQWISVGLIIAAMMSVMKFLIGLV